MEFAYAAREKSVGFATWHKRLAHASVDKIFFLVNTKFDKASIKPFDNSLTRANDILQIVHSGVCGPLDVISMSGAKYFVTFIDDHTRKVFVYIMKAKSEVFSKFMIFKGFVENQAERKIKTIRTDNGTEYVNKKNSDACISNGIRHEKLCLTDHNKMV